MNNEQTATEGSEDQSTETQAEVATEGAIEANAGDATNEEAQNQSDAEIEAPEVVAEEPEVSGDEDSSDAQTFTEEEMTAGSTDIIIEKVNTGNQADVDLIVNGRRSSLQRGKKISVTDAQLAVLDASHVNYEVTDSSGDEAADVEGSASAADAETEAEADAE